MSDEDFRIPHGNFRALFDYVSVLEMYNDGNEADEISNFVEASPGMISRFLKDYNSYDTEIAQNWVEIMHRLWEIECERGSIPQQDNLLKILRTVFNDYILDPTIPNKPTLSDVNWNFKELLEVEINEKNQFIAASIDGVENSFENTNRNWVEFFSNFDRRDTIHQSWNGSSLGGFVEWLNEFLFRGWKLYELRSDLDNDTLHASFKQLDLSSNKI